MGFEPTRAEPNGLAVHRLNHSATSSWATSVSFIYSQYLMWFSMQSDNIYAFLLYFVFYLTETVQELAKLFK